MRLRSMLNTATTEQVGYGIISFFCVLAPEGMNLIVLGRDNGKRSERFLLAQKIYRQKIIFSLLASSKKKGDCHFTKNKVVIFRVILLRDVQHATYDTH